MDVERKTIGELIDELITTSNKIYHLLDKAVCESDGQAAVDAQHLNARRVALVQAINHRLDSDNIVGKVFVGERKLGKDS